MTKLAEIQEIPTLEGGWINLTEAADILGYTRSYMYKKASKFGTPGGFDTLRKIGSQASYVVSRTEVEAILQDATDKAAEEKVEPVAEKPAKKPRVKKEKPAPEPESVPVEDKEVASANLSEEDQAALEQGLKDSAAGDTHDLGEFSQFADEETEEEGEEELSIDDILSQL